MKYQYLAIAVLMTCLIFAGAALLKRGADYLQAKIQIIEVVR